MPCGGAGFFHSCLIHSLLQIFLSVATPLEQCASKEPAQISASLGSGLSLCLSSCQWLQHHTAALCSSCRLIQVFINSTRAVCPTDSKGTAPRAHLKALTSLHAESLFFTFFILTSGQICAFRKSKTKNPSVSLVF